MWTHQPEVSVCPLKSAVVSWDLDSRECQSALSVRPQPSLGLLGTFCALIDYGRVPRSKALTDTVSLKGGLLSLRVRIKGVHICVVGKGSTRVLFSLWNLLSFNLLLYS